jgi:hypothetical protein
MLTYKSTKAWLEVVAKHESHSKGSVDIGCSEGSSRLQGAWERSPAGGVPGSSSASCSGGSGCAAAPPSCCTGGAGPLMLSCSRRQSRALFTLRHGWGRRGLAQVVDGGARPGQGWDRQLTGAAAVVRLDVGAAGATGALAACPPVPQLCCQLCRQGGSEAFLFRVVVVRWGGRRSARMEGRRMASWLPTGE